MYADNVRLLQPTILTARVCGVCPSALRKVWIPLSNKLYAVVLAVVGILHFPLGAGEYNRLNDITAFIFVCHWIMRNIRVWVSLITPFLFCEELVRFFVIVESVQKSLFELNIRQPPNPSKRSQIAWVVIAFTPILCILAFNTLEDSVLFLFFIPQEVVMTGSFLKTRVLLDLLHEKFALLIWHLDDLNDRWPMFLPRPADPAFREFSSVADFRRTKFVLPSRDDRTVTAEKINEFNKTHLKLVYACKTLQRIFSFEWFILTISCALEFIFFFFKMTQTNDRLFGLLLFALIAHFSATLTVMLTLTTKIKEQSDRVAILVHDLLDEDRHAADVVEELEQFSLALVHRKVNFSAAGFFDFDLKLLSKMASLLAPIVLFLVQNQNRPRAGRNKPQLAATPRP